MNTVQTFIVFTGISIAAMTALFPPWASIVAGASYFPVAFQWAFSSAPVIGGSVYRVDIFELQMRLAIILVGTAILFAIAGLIQEK